jgi:hypothetical protein
MTLRLSESEIVKALASEVAGRITRRCMAELRKLDGLYQGDSTVLRNFWEELCVQIQYDQSVLWDAYDDCIQEMVRVQVQNLPRHEREALWLQSDAGCDWLFDDESEREAYRVTLDDVVEHLKSKHLYAAAGSWTNPRIRTYIERASQTD